MLLLLNRLFGLLLLKNLTNKYTDNLIKVCEYIRLLEKYSTVLNTV